MKKTFLSFLAVTVFITLSAFLVDRNVTKANDTEYDFWYYISDNHVTGIFDYNKMKSQVLGTAPCPDDGDIVCLLGTDESLSTNQEIDPLDYGDDQLVAFDDD